MPTSTADGLKIKLSKTTTTTMCYLVSNVLRKATAFPLWSVMDSRWMLEQQRGFSSVLSNCSD